MAAQRSGLVSVIVLVCALASTAGASDILDPNMVLWYELDGSGANTVAVDSSGYDHHGYIDVSEGDPNWDPNGGIHGGALIFNNDTAIEVPGDATANINSGITISCWLRGIDNPDEDNWIFSIGSGDYQVRAAVFSQSGLVEWRAGNDTNDVLVWDIGYIDPEVWTDWLRWVFVKDEDAGTMSIYVESSVYLFRVGWCNCMSESKSGVDSTLVNVRGAPMKIGAIVEHNNDYIGSMDDFRLFDRSLTECEICSCWDNNLAWMPSPFNGQSDVPHDVVLEWHPGYSAVYHDVYLGTNYAEVADANTSSSQYMGRLDVNSYDPCGLLWDTKYYWRIDEANDSVVWKGRVWQFTVADFILIDDMESYDPFINMIYYHWENPDFTGSYVDLGMVPFDPVHGGDQSMEYVYDNSVMWDFYHYWSEAEYTFDTPQDWTEQDVKVLTLYFYGDPNNDANRTEQMYVGLQDNTFTHTNVDYPDMNDIHQAEWHEWNVALSEFDGVDPGAIEKIYLGFGSKDSTTIPGGLGVVYFDDVRLYRSRCVASCWMPDFTEDCIVDNKDLKVMAESWLVNNPDIELSGDSIINGVDFSIFAPYWMQEQFWPD